MRNFLPESGMNIEALESARRLHTDKELTVVSEAANPGIRDSLAEFGALRGGASEANVAARFRETLHFSVFALGGSFVVVHRFGIADNDIAGAVADEIFRPEYVPIPDAFERCFAGVVLSSAESADDAWRNFYANTISKLEIAAVSEPRPDDFSPTSVFGRIYERARERVVGSSVLDVGTCFGFFPMYLRRAEPELRVTALDVSEPMIELAGKNVEGAEFVVGDARDLPFPADAFDTVVSLHVIEHLSNRDASRAVAEMRRVARRRVVVAVPFEDEPDPAFGHTQSFDRESLTRLADGRECAFEEYLGGWMVLDAGLTGIRRMD